MREEYEKAARASYENSLALFEEAELLAKHSRFARAYVLCVLSAEEHYKSFLYKGVSAGVISRSFARHRIIRHDRKIIGLFHLVVVPWVLLSHMEELVAATQHDRTQKDHAKHEFPGMIDSIAKNSSPQVESLASVLRDANTLKLEALYVDIVKRSVKVPSDRLWAKRFRKIHDVLRLFVRSDHFVRLDDEGYRKTVETFLYAHEEVIGIRRRQ